MRRIVSSMVEKEYDVIVGRNLPLDHLLDDIFRSSLALHTMSHRIASEQSLASLLNFPETADIETSSEGYARRFSGAIGSWLNVQEEATLRLLAPYPGARILDVGGGHGQLTSPLIRNGFRVTVLGSADVCQLRIEKFVAEKRCSFKVGNILDLPFPKQAFDIVVSYRLLPHVSRWNRLVSELSRVAKTAVIVDYPAICSVNYLTPFIFPLKKTPGGQYTTVHLF